MKNIKRREEDTTFLFACYFSTKTATVERVSRIFLEKLLLLNIHQTVKTKQNNDSLTPLTIFEIDTN
jgi:hypothetical protein